MLDYCSLTSEYFVFYEGGEETLKVILSQLSHGFELMPCIIGNYLYVPMPRP